jgi:hypothetical protein
MKEIAMRMTKHIDQRMNQRGMNKDVIDAVRFYGEPDGNEVVLGRKHCDQLIARRRRELKALTRIRDKGGVAIVEVGEALVTTYPLGRSGRRVPFRGAR